MTRRQVYFYSKETGTYYVSGEYNGDRSELEQFGSSDSCDKDWEDILRDLSHVGSLPEFMSTLSNINRCYHSSIEQQIPGTRLHVINNKSDMSVKDETYGINSDDLELFLDEDLSLYSK